MSDPDPTGSPACSALLVRKRWFHDPKPGDMANLSPAERIALVWPLTLAAWAFKDDANAPARLPRHVVRVGRRGR